MAVELAEGTVTYPDLPPADSVELSRATAIAIARNAAVIFGFAVLVAEVAGNSGRGLAGAGRAALAVVRNPLILSGALGVLWASLGLVLSGPLDVLLATLASATAPCALVAIGLFIARPRQSAEPAVMGRILILKLIGQPLATYILIAMLPPMPPLWAKTAILIAAMPSATSSFLIAGGAGRWAMETSARAIVLTTVASAVTLAALLIMIDVGI